MKRGFTLLELLIVIGILAILATTVTLVLNPAELLKQARDSQRLGDLRSVHAALGMYVSTATTTPLFIATTTCSTTGAVSPFSTSCQRITSTNVSGTGWVNVNFGLTAGGSPLSKLPLDPVNTATYFYAYKNNVSDTTWEIDGRLESIKYRDQMVDDGGDRNTCSTYIESTCFYEIGSSPGLSL